MIKFIVICRIWYDGLNCYHSVKISSVKTGKLIYDSFEKKHMGYGFDPHMVYGSDPRNTALEWLAKNKYLPVKYHIENEWWSYEMDNDYPIYRLTIEVSRKKNL